MSERETIRWSTITGPLAHCCDCSWGQNGDYEARRLLRAARNHAEVFNHTVHVERGQVAVLNDSAVSRGTDRA